MSQGENDFVDVSTKKWIPQAVNRANSGPAHDIEADEKPDVEDLNYHIERDVRKYLNVIDRLRSSGLENLHIDLPKIAVIGDQSSGKSSVLESLSGIQFPRGTGLVTRCATEVRMTRVKAKGIWEATVYTTKDPHTKRHLTDREEIGKVITELTNTLAKPGCVSEESIVIEVKASDVPDLTIIDLPGLTRAKTSEQAHGFKEAVEELVKRYVANDRTINLCVVPANADIATVGSFQFAEEVDPEGLRTIGVLTKCDLIDQGTEQDSVVKVLENQIKPLKLGYSAVRNRGQKDIEGHISLAEARKREDLFFKKNPVYSALISQGKLSYFGMNSLAARLTSNLVQRIRHLLPQITQEIMIKLQDARKGLKDCGNKVSQERWLDELTSRTTKLHRVIEQAFVEAIYREEPLAGCWAVGLGEEGKNRLKKLRFYCRLKEECFERFKKDIEALRPQFDEDSFIAELREKAKLSAGRQLPGLVNTHLFDEIASSYGRQVNNRAYALVEQVKSIISDFMFELMKHDDKRFPRLLEKTLVSTQKIVDELGNICRAEVTILLECDEHPFTMDSAFVERIFALRTNATVEWLSIELKKLFDNLPSTNFRSGPVSPPPEAVRQVVEKALRLQQDDGLYEAELLRTYLRAYWDQSMIRLIDNVCRTIDTLLVRKFPANWFNRMIALDENFRPESLMEEEFDVTVRREMLQAKEKQLNDAMSTLSLIM